LKHTHQFVDGHTLVNANGEELQVQHLIMYLKLSSVSLRNVLLESSLRWRFGLNNYFFQCSSSDSCLNFLW